MASPVIKLFILLCFLYEAKGWTAMSILDENEAYPGKCYDENDGTPLILDLGETFIPPPPACHKMVCSKYGEKKYSISYTGKYSFLYEDKNHRVGKINNKISTVSSNKNDPKYILILLAPFILRISVSLCGSVGAPEGCEVVRDESATYPECCEPILRCE
ncbi:hypothetical protein Avbf_18453 [Armadillidium vulgare]|nr:hypothetical protein Avbf_18453 [Armadillidium vulgare]